MTVLNLKFRRGGTRNRFLSVRMAILQMPVIKFQSLTICGALLLFGSAAGRADEIDFGRDVRPILSDKCFHCHGPDEATREADLRLDQQESAMADRDGHPVIKPGDVSNSQLFHRITSKDEYEVMPPPETKKPLTDQEIRILKQWIQEGAAWSKHWAFEPPVRHDVPEVRDTGWPANWIDHFVRHRLEQENLQPSAAADPATLLRRISFDLTGLPPTTQQAETFIANPSEAVYEDIVDELLQSSAYGERMAIYWLDLVRYADTVGYHGDQDQNIYPYRDWVINSFNANMPFDQMTREQLAGDLLDNATIDQKIATGYNRLLQTTHEGGLQEKEYRAIYAADRVRNVSAVWMGATVGCAQCHDHKFDPYTAKDFYALAAFFDDVDDEQHFKSGTNSLPTRREPELRLPTAELKQQLAELDQQITELRKRANAADLNDAEKQKRKKALDAASARKRSVEARIPRTMITVALKTPRVTRILPRGNWLDESGDVVIPAVPEFLNPSATAKRLSRLDLANWLIDSQNGNGLFTARVLVNRLWYLFFGSGLSARLDDFGGQGEAPVHPELLDRLAYELVESGWDIQHVIRAIVLSRTYQQSSIATSAQRDRDPSNRLYARQSAYRLPAEMVRDNALLISGLLNRELGGPSVKPYQPAGYYRHLNFPNRKYEADTDSRQWRRGLYVHWQRQFLHPMLKAFDAPSREECTAERSRSNTPLAALALLNDPTFVEAATSFAVQTLKNSKSSDRKKIESAFFRAVTRQPTQAEVEVLTALLNENRAIAAKQVDAVKGTSVGNIGHNESTEAGELAAWTTVCRAILNLAETNTRN